MLKKLNNFNNKDSIETFTFPFLYRVEMKVKELTLLRLID